MQNRQSSERGRGGGGTGLGGECKLDGWQWPHLQHSEVEDIVQDLPREVETIFWHENRAAAHRGVLIVEVPFGRPGAEVSVGIPSVRRGDLDAWRGNMGMGGKTGKQRTTNSTTPTSHGAPATRTLSAILSSVRIRRLQCLGVASSSKMCTSEAAMYPFLYICSRCSAAPCSEWPCATEVVA